jgi:hypothetical protein
MQSTSATVNTSAMCIGDLDPITLQPFPAQHTADDSPSGRHGVLQDLQRKL